MELGDSRRLLGMLCPLLCDDLFVESWAIGIFVAAITDWNFCKDARQSFGLGNDSSRSYFCNRAGYFY